MKVKVNCVQGHDIQDKTNESGFQSHYGGAFVDKEMKKIQQMKNQQKKEIEFIIQNDMRVQEMYKVQIFCQ